MQKYLTDSNIQYKIIGINKSYSFEFNDMTFIYYVSGCYYHCLTIYVPSIIFEKMYGILEGIISLTGVIETMNIYKYTGQYNTFDEINYVLNIIKFGNKYNWIK